MKFRELKERLLIAMLRHQRQVGFSERMEPIEIANQTGLSHAPGQIRLCAEDYESMGYIRVSYYLGGGDDGGISCSLTASGIEAAEELEEAYVNNGDLEEESNTPVAAAIPASNRYVSVKDNQPAFNDLTDRLSAIKNEYAKDHNRLASEPDADEVLSEIDAVLAQINRGKVRLGQIADGLLPKLGAACIALSAYPGFVQLLHDAIPVAQAILTFFGLA